MKLPIFSDTSSDMEELRLKLIASLSPEERFARMNRLSAFGKQAMLEGLREKNQELSEEELRLLLAKNLWGEGFANHLRKKMQKENG